MFALQKEMQRLNDIVLNHRFHELLTFQYPCCVYVERTELNSPAGACTSGFENFEKLYTKGASGSRPQRERGTTISSPSSLLWLGIWPESCHTGFTSKFPMDSLERDVLDFQNSDNSTGRFYIIRNH
ncbi:uncharacterized protein ALTATR162_LOCUS6821 [Alternaria atra]|uniref:Uncharacterized protein n=1 Tax=Alternaria atra TaxID=119953 RepID=A0A8J2N1B0_9PLEO|nr:uncharacterized protein ALTATR162_LOCUS6821 [Alternaria atra]CAG5165656.1 unnamed protein product [Alternaria atra]